MTIKLNLFVVYHGISIDKIIFHVSIELVWIVTFKRWINQFWQLFHECVVHLKLVSTIITKTEREKRIDILLKIYSLLYQVIFIFTK